ncbi:MAG: S8 family serine peptidase [Gammaproteobacteria bacterium]|nr:S8 family serine peptidase [Gammaproteobacteria bacterium]
MDIKLYLQKIIQTAFLLISGVGLANATAQYIIKINPYSVKSFDGYHKELFIKNKLSIIFSNENINNIILENIVENVYIIKLPSLDAIQDKDRLVNLTDPDIIYFTTDYAGYFKPIPDPKISLTEYTDLTHSAQWNHFVGPAGISLESKAFANDLGWSFWQNKTKKADKSVIVGVLDTGIEENKNLSESVLKNKNKFFGWNFSGNNNDLTDETKGYHGTHVAGIIAAQGPDAYSVGIGGTDIKPNIKILPVKIPDRTGMFYESNVIRAIYWAVGAHVNGVPNNIYPVQVINMSFGIDERIGKEIENCSPAVQEAIDYAINKGVTIVVAAGNKNSGQDAGSPGGCTGVIRVASTGPTGLRSYFSNYGMGVNFAAPGGDKKYGKIGGILSTVKEGAGTENSGLDFFQGTSMAAPHVSGLIGLLHALDNKNKLTPKDIENLLSVTAHDFSNDADNLTLENSCYGEKSCGHGIVDAYNALQALVARYDVLLSSPSAKLLDLKAHPDCKEGEVIPNKQSLDLAVGRFTIDSNPDLDSMDSMDPMDSVDIRCQLPEAYEQPKLELLDNKQIKVHYGKVSYTLQHDFVHCNKIGFDGLGCYWPESMHNK